MILNRHNPDVLMCLANLSNDEVFTPPKLANQMLDTLPEELWSNPEAKFLDPFCKSGVFLREITKRLIKGLEHFEPDLQKRVNHIMEHQVYGIGITELTALMTRRSLYCTKSANGKHSVTNVFDMPEGNVAYDRIEHTFQNGKCTYCGASQEVYDRGDELETHAYQFIHNNNPFENMQFDVIIGNPPYQLSDGGGRDSGAISLYHKFVQQAKKLSPRYISMIIPARWYSGGKGMNEFRTEMLNDKRISVLHDFPETSDCFPGLNIRGGVCFFLWDINYNGECEVNNYKNGLIINKERRFLLEPGMDVLVRYNEAISILRKVRKISHNTLDSYVSARKPFSIESNHSEFSNTLTSIFNIKLYRFGETGYINESQVLKNKELIKKYKVLVSKASPGGDEYPHSIISQPILAEPYSVCTETYLIVSSFDKRENAQNLITYLKTRFFRFMMSLVKNTQNISRASYSLVPLQDFSEPWTDEKLYKKYNLTQEEIDFIESMIRPMD